jgi:hypothetical protein
MASGIWKFIRLYVFNPGPVYSQGHIVFALTRDRTGVTSNTCFAIEKKPKPSHGPPRRLKIARITANILR